MSDGDGGRPVSMREVALRAGVSPATVSRVLNSSASVREPHRARVLAAVAELDYRPNRLARNLRRQRADMIGVVVSDIENPHFTEMVRAVEDAAYRKRLSGSPLQHRRVRGQAARLPRGPRAGAPARRDRRADRSEPATR